MARAAKTAAPESSAAASPTSSPAPEDGDRLRQINKAFSSAGPDDPFGADDIFSTEDAGTIDPFLPYIEKGGDSSASAPLNQDSAPAPQPVSVFAEEFDDGSADPIFAEAPAPSSASGASHAEEGGARSFSTSHPSPQQPEEGLFKSAASSEDRDEEPDILESGEGQFEPVPLQRTASLPIEDADVAPADMAPAETAFSDHSSSETISNSPAQLSVAVKFSKPAQFMESSVPVHPASAPPDQGADPETTTAAILTLSTDPSATESRDTPMNADGNDSETTAAAESSGHGEPPPPAEPGGLRTEAPPEPPIASVSSPEEAAEDDPDHREDEDWGGPAQTSLEEARSVASFVQDSDMSVDFSEELDTLKTQVDSLITSYNQIHQENSELKRQCAEAEESIHRYAEDCQRLHLENEQLKPLRALNRELQEEIADVQREKRHYEGMVRNIRDKNREAASAMHKMIVRLGDIDPSS